MKINKLIFVFFFFCALIVSAQKKSRTQLEKEKKENHKKIEETNKILLETRSKKNSTIGQLTALKHKIKLRKDLIESINEEVSLLESEIQQIQLRIFAQQSKIDTLKKEYADMVVAANRLGNGLDRLVYIFSSESIAQMTMRVKYFQQYSEDRKQQLVEIENAKRDLQIQATELRFRLNEKNDLLGKKTEETNILNQEKDEQKKVLTQLSTQEKKLRAELAERKDASRKLDKLISDMIAAEREKAMKAAKKAAEKKKATQKKSANTKEKEEDEYKIELTPEARSLSNSFAENQGKLPWPVQRGNISLGFGKQPHPSLKNVYIDNLGVDIQTNKEESVRAVFQGKVITVAEVPGLNKVVMVQHGEYFTVYARLRSVSVKTGDEVGSKQSIGTVYTDRDEVSQLQFQIWKNNLKMDPEGWLYKR